MKIEVKLNNEEFCDNCVFDKHDSAKCVNGYIRNDARVYDVDTKAGTVVYINFKRSDMCVKENG